MDVESGSAKPRTDVSSEIVVRGHRLVQDKPPQLGGKDEGPMASELLLAGLLACQLSTFRKIADKRRKPDVKAVAIRGDLHFRDGDIERVALSWKVQAPPAVADGELRTLFRLTDGACTITKAMKVPIAFEFERA